MTYTLRNSMEIVIASTNLHKIREFRDMLKQFAFIDVLSLLNFPDFQALPESGKTFEENARTKAEFAAHALQRFVLADDSGLIIPALGDESPSLHSRRYAGDDATDAENRIKLLTKMQHLKDIHRSAYYECCLALASPKGVKKVATGTCQGFILMDEKGRHGFGYDSLFVKEGYDKSFAELDEHTKNRISHRRKAIEKMSTTLETLTKESCVLLT
jgi:XTP/dITP diphosphohydrolase